MTLDAKSREVFLRKVEENYKFPCKLAFNLIVENDGSTCIISTTINSKAKVDNVKYVDARSATWTSKGSALLSVKELRNPQEYLDETLHLQELWKFAIVKKEDDQNAED